MNSITRKKTAKLTLSERRKIIPLLIPYSFRKQLPPDYRMRFFEYANNHQSDAKRSSLFDALRQIEVIYTKGISRVADVKDLEFYFEQFGLNLKIDYSLLR